MLGIKDAKPSRIYLIRHGHSTANEKGVLAGRDYGVFLTERGANQAVAVADQLRGINFAKIYSSPLPRCLETVKPLLVGRSRKLIEDYDAIEMEYGQWSGKKLLSLSRKRMWRDIQMQPSTVRFPDGESFEEMQNRILKMMARVALSGKNILICSHGDVIKAAIAGVLNLHLDQFQKLVIEPASISIVEYSTNGASLISSNQTGHLSNLKAPKKNRASKFRLGGGSGAS